MSKGKKKRKLPPTEYYGWRSKGKVDTPKHYWIHVTFTDDREPFNARHFAPLPHLQVIADAIANGTCTLAKYQFPVEEIESVEIIDSKCSDPNWAGDLMHYHAEPRHFEWFGKESKPGVLQEIADRVRGIAS